MAIIKRFVLYVLIFYLIKKKYQNSKDKLIVLNEIKKGIEFDFNNLRYNFFSKLNQEEVKKYISTIFICDIIPYWKNNIYITIWLLIFLLNLSFKPAIIN